MGQVTWDNSLADAGLHSREGAGLLHKSKGRGYAASLHPYRGQDMTPYPRGLEKEETEQSRPSNSLKKGKGREMLNGKWKSFHSQHPSREGEGRGETNACRGNYQVWVKPIHGKKMLGKLKKRPVWVRKKRLSTAKTPPPTAFLHIRGEKGREEGVSCKHWKIK